MKRHPKKKLRGAAAIETALSLTVLLLLFSILMNLGHAMLVRHRLQSATGRAARVCSLARPNLIQQCVDAQVVNELGAMIGACPNPDVVADPRPIAGVSVLRVETNCVYSGGPWTSMLERWAGEAGRYRLRAEAVMPTR